MKIKLLTVFQGLELTDQEKVFMFFVTKILQENGFLEDYVMHTLDAKILMLGKGAHCHLTHNTISKEIQKVLKFAIYSDRKIGFTLTKEAREWLRLNGDSRYCGIFHDEIQDPQAQRIYLYMLGATAHAENLVVEGTGTGGIEVGASYHHRKIDRVDLSSLINVEELDC